MAELPSMASQDRLPLINYAKRHCWGNPQLNQQFQLRLARVSHELGFTKNFVYAGKQYLLPESDRFYNVFTLGGLFAGYYGLGTRVFSWAPFDRWVNSSEYLEKRGVMLDFYNEKGLMYNRTDTWIMQCFNGTTLVAFVKNNRAFPMPVAKPMYMRCYTPDVPTYNVMGYKDNKAQIEVTGVTYYDFRDWDSAKKKYDEYVAKGYGKITVYHNGVIKKITDIAPSVGDLIEFVLDPTIERTVTYKYVNLKNYYSERDKKSKVILFPWLDNPKRQYFYFDDCEFYVFDRTRDVGIYLHRNNQDCVRQLTHQDYGVAGDYVETVANYLANTNPSGKGSLDDIDIVVTYHRTTWEYYLGPTTSRIADLYLLEDPDKILNAMTGAFSNLKEWTAPELENSPHNKLLGMEYTDITNDDVFAALGYNGASSVLSNPLFYMPGVAPGDEGFEDLYTTPPYETGMGYLVPATYRVNSTVYEYNKLGELIRLRSNKWSEHYRPSEDAVFCEYALGDATTYLDIIYTQSTVTIEPEYGFRVYKAPWRIFDDDEEEKEKTYWSNEWSISKDGQPLYQTDTFVQIDTDAPDDTPDVDGPWSKGEIAGPWEDITGSSDYTFDSSTGQLSWNINMNNYLGIIVRDSKHLFFQVNVKHLDKSISFSLIHLWEIGGTLLPLKPAQLDIWMNGKPMIENVDYLFDFPTVYVVNKQHLVDGAESIDFQVRATGLSKDGIYNRSELGFVTNGVIGYNGRYNLRINRPTKLVSNGRIFLTQSADWAETKGHGENFQGLEGFPYEVKHYVCLNKYVENYTTQKGLEADVDLDTRISQYLTEYVDYKPKTPPDSPFQSDRYRLFSPFMSQLYNELRLGFKTTPTTIPTNQEINELTQDIQFLLKYDPCVLNFTEAYFEIHPCSNIGYQPITPMQLTILEKVNTLYLNDRIVLRGHFEVVDE